MDDGRDIVCSIAEDILFLKALQRDLSEMLKLDYCLREETRGAADFREEKCRASNKGSGPHVILG